MASDSVLKFSARATKYNPETGKLSESHTWHKNDVAKNRYINEYHTYNPMNFEKSFVRSSTKGDYIKFQHSDMETDSGQNAVPFIDVQVVTPKPPAPLIGAGFYWKTRFNSGGLIGVRVIPQDYSNFMEDLNAENQKELLDAYAEKWKTDKF